MPTAGFSSDAVKHIEEFARAFVRKERRERFTSMLTNPKKRPQWRDRMNHRFGDDLDAKVLHELPPKNFTALIRDDVSAYVIADDNRFDNKLCTADQALLWLDDCTFGILVSLIPGALAVYKSESPSHHTWIFKD